MLCTKWRWTPEFTLHLPLSGGLTPLCAILYNDSVIAETESTYRLAGHAGYNDGVIAETESTLQAGRAC